MYQHLLLFQFLTVKYFCSPSYSSLCLCGIHFVQLRQLIYVTACGLDLSGYHQKNYNQKWNLGTAVQKLVWKWKVCRVRYVRDGCCLSCCCFTVLLDNILIIVSSTYLLNVTFVKRYLGKHQINGNCIQEEFKSTLK